MRKHSIDRMIYRTLAVFILLSAVLVSVGIILSLYTGTSSQIGTSFMTAVVLVLFATPVARVVMSILAFLEEKNRLYVIITSVVLTNILMALFVLPIFLRA